METQNVLCLIGFFFGPDGHKDQPGESILKDYMRRESHLHPFTKYIAKSYIFRKLREKMCEYSIDPNKLKGF